MRMDSSEARTSGRKTRPCRKAPLKPKNGLNGPPSLANTSSYLTGRARRFASSAEAESGGGWSSDLRDHLLAWNPRGRLG